MDIFNRIALMNSENDAAKRPTSWPSAALIATGMHAGVILYAKPGCDLYYEMHELGTDRTDDYGLDNAPPGLCIWEGTSSWEPGGYECPADGQMNYEGKFRPLTHEEIQCVMVSRPIWPPLAEVGEEGADEDGGDSPVAP